MYERYLNSGGNLMNVTKTENRLVRIQADSVTLDGNLGIPDDAQGL
jgi:hypothetical protein